MARLSDLVCTDTGLPSAQVYDRNRCFCLPCNRYSYVRARWPITEKKDTVVTQQHLHFIYDRDQHPQLVLISGDYMIHAWVSPLIGISVCEVYRTTHPDYLMESANQNDHGMTNPAGLFNAYSPIPFQTCLRLLRKRAAKYLRDELRELGFSPRQAVPAADCYD